MNVSGNGMVFRNEHEKNGDTWYSYAVGISSKDREGNWVSATMPIRFKKGIEVADRTRINITNGFFSVRAYEKEGQTRKIIEIMCLEYEEVMSGSNMPEGFTSLQDEDIPF